MTAPRKVMANDQYVDLRSSLSTGKLSQHCNCRHPTLVNGGVEPDKESLVKDLVHNYNSIVNRTHNDRKTKDLTTNDPRFQNFRPQEHGKFINSQSEVSLLSKAECTRTSLSSSKIIRPSTNNVDMIQKIKEEIQRDCYAHMDSGEPNAMTTEISNLQNYSGGNTDMQDPKLLRKRSWTLPVITRKSNDLLDQFDDIVDRQTYKYDDGTEIDSLFIRPIISPNGKVFHTKLMIILFILGSGTGILVVTLLIWFMFTNEILKTIIKPKNEIGIVKKSLRMVSGAILYVISSTVNAIGNILTLPTHQVYQPTEPNPLWS